MISARALSRADSPAHNSPNFAKYEKACRDEGVVVLRSHVNLEAGRAYCLNMAESAEQVRRAHEAVGLPFETITEVAALAANASAPR